MGRKKKEGERLPDSLHGLESRWVVDKGFKIAPPSAAIKLKRGKGRKKGKREALAAAANLLLSAFVLKISPPPHQGPLSLPAPFRLSLLLLLLLLLLILLSGQFLFRCGAGRKRRRKPKRTRFSHPMPILRCFFRPPTLFFRGRNGCLPGKEVLGSPPCFSTSKRGTSPPLNA